MNKIFHSWPILFVSALALHIGKIQTFQHNGAGLPKLSSPVIWPLMVLSVLAGVLRGAVLLPDTAVLVTVLACLLSMVLLRLIAGIYRKQTAFAGFLLTAIGADLIAAAAGTLLPGASNLLLFMNIWCGVTFAVLYGRLPKDSHDSTSSI